MTDIYFLEHLLAPSTRLCEILKNPGRRIVMKFAKNLPSATLKLDC